MMYLMPDKIRKSWSRETANIARHGLQICASVEELAALEYKEAVDFYDFEIQSFVILLVFI